MSASCHTTIGTAGCPGGGATPRRAWTRRCDAWTPATERDGPPAADDVDVGMEDPRRGGRRGRRGGSRRGSLDVEVAALRDLVAILRERRDAIPEELTRHDADADADRRAARPSQMLSEPDAVLLPGRRALDRRRGWGDSGAQDVARGREHAEPRGFGDAPPAGRRGRGRRAWRCLIAVSPLVPRVLARLVLGAAGAPVLS